MLKNNRFVVCGGGTGGHLFPAIEISNQLLEKGADVLYMGSKYGIEANQIINKEQSFLLDIKGLHRTFSLSNLIDNFIFPFRIFFSIIKSLKIIYNFNPKVVIGTGGYSSGIPLISALILRKKILLQEQNSYPGITTRMLSIFAHKICIGYQNSNQYIKKRTIYTGNPIRSNILITNKNNAKDELKININKFTLFFCGGSQGSKPINDHIINNLDYYNNLDAEIIWQCGIKNYQSISLLNLNNNIKLYDFINDIGKIYSASDLIISRSGALTLSEINFFGKASILIPFPFSAGNHQYKNALFSSNSNAAIIVKQKHLSNGILEKTINDLIKSPEKIKLMEIAAKSISTPKAIDIIIQEINSLIC